MFVPKWGHTRQTKKTSKICCFILAVKVKWGKENFPNVEVNTDEEPMLFKAQLYALTGVQPERQKVLCKGINLKDDEWNMPIKDVSEFWFVLIEEFLTKNLVIFRREPFCCCSGRGRRFRRNPLRSPSLSRT